MEARTNKTWSHDVIPLKVWDYTHRGLLRKTILSTLLILIQVVFYYLDNIIWVQICTSFSNSPWLIEVALKKETKQKEQHETGTKKNMLKKYKRHKGQNNQIHAWLYI